jgi:hypothetical protein
MGCQGEAIQKSESNINTYRGDVILIEIKHRILNTKSSPATSALSPFSLILLRLLKTYITITGETTRS